MATTRAAIAELYASGLTIPVIARQLDLAPTTVSYHVKRLAGGTNTEESDAKAPPDGVVSDVPTRRQVATMLAAGVARAEIARRLGISKATVSYHARRLGETIDERCARRYDWEAVQRYYDEGHSVRDCMKAFGFSAASWFDAVNRGALVARPSATPISELLVAGTYRGRFNLKARLVREGLKRNRCEQCGPIDWRGQPLTLALHHVNGQRHDNRLENLMLLCPNCHSQTDNYAGRNGHRHEG
ncbi:MAG: helix-turn-helix domain-containing protein [Actinomycetota bacterium]|nr:helix-turn-helix domain-containing protein [Actinomycetota bacterium]